MISFPASYQDLASGEPPPFSSKSQKFTGLAKVFLLQPASNKPSGAKPNHK